MRYAKPFRLNAIPNFVKFLTADALVRYCRVLGYDTYFLTG